MKSMILILSVIDILILEDIIESDNYLMKQREMNRIKFRTQQGLSQTMRSLEQQLQKKQTTYVDLLNMWKTNNLEHQKRFKAIQESQLFSPQRLITFLKFNYRTYEAKDVNYQKVFEKKIGKTQKYIFSKTRQTRGTMNVTDLWSEKSLQFVIGSPALPRDRIKMLKYYQKSNGNCQVKQNNYLETTTSLGRRKILKRVKTQLTELQFDQK